MAEPEKEKLELLRRRVIDLVVDFINSKGGMSQQDLVAVLGPTHEQTVTDSLLKTPAKISFCWTRSHDAASANEEMAATLQKKRESLVEKVLELVKEFINHNGGMSPYELSLVFPLGMVADALARMPLYFHGKLPA